MNSCKIRWIYIKKANQIVFQSSKNINTKFKASQNQDDQSPILITKLWYLVYTLFKTTTSSFLLSFSFFKTMRKSDLDSFVFSLQMRFIARFIVGRRGSWAPLNVRSRICSSHHLSVCTPSNFEWPWEKGISCDPLTVKAMGDTIVDWSDEELGSFWAVEVDFVSLLPSVTERSVDSIISVWTVDGVSVNSEPFVYKRVGAANRFGSMWTSRLLGPGSPGSWTWDSLAYTQSRMIWLCFR